MPEQARKRKERKNVLWGRSSIRAERYLIRNQKMMGGLQKRGKAQGGRRSLTRKPGGYGRAESGGTLKMGESSERNHITGWKGNRKGYTEITTSDGGEHQSRLGGGGSRGDVDLGDHYRVYDLTYKMMQRNWNKREGGAALIEDIIMTTRTEISKKGKAAEVVRETKKIKSAI